MKATVNYKVPFYLGTFFFFLVQLGISQNINSTQNQDHAENLGDSKIRVSNILFSGVLLENKDKQQTWYFPNAFEWFPANTVEGFVFNPQVRFTQHYKDGRFFSMTPNARYGFGNERFQAQLKTQYFYSPNTNGLFELSGGRAIEQLFDESTLSALNNTFYTYAVNENFLKIYERSYVAVGHSFSPVKDFLLTTSVSWNERNPLSNLARYEEDADFSSNDPENSELENTAFPKHQAVIIDASLRWQVGHRLKRQRGQLLSEGKYPALTLSYTHATDAILGGDVSYQKLAFRVQDEFKVGSGFGSALVEAGDFLQKDRLTFVDFTHFKGKQTVYGTYANDQFQLLEYYENSTSEFYVQGHYEHYFGMFDKGGKFKFQPVAGVHYLYTDAGGHYMEFGAGMAKILDHWRIDFYNSWREGQHQDFGVRIGFDF